MKKPITSNYFNSFKELSKKINGLILSGKWQDLSEIEKKRTINNLKKLYFSLKNKFSQRRLAKVLGVCAIFVGSNLIAQNFLPPVYNPSGIKGVTGYFQGMCFGDLDNDGDFDIMISESYYEGGDFFYQKNIGSATIANFADTIRNPFNLSPTSSNGYKFNCVLADIDNDGDLDLFSAGGSYYGGLLFYPNNGTPTSPSFGAEQVNPSGANLTYYTIFQDIIDIDGDGDLDIIASYNYDTLITKFYENTGSAIIPSFATPVDRPFGLNDQHQGFFMDFVDFDGDGDYDMFTVDYYGGLIYQENIGSATNPNFAAPITNAFNVPLSPYAIAPEFVDIDNDGDQDLFVGQYYYGVTAFYENNGNITSQNELTSNDLTVYPNPTNNMLNIDGLTEVVSVNVINIQGKQITSYTNVQSAINVSELKQGSYFLEINQKEKDPVRIKFMKN